MTESREDKENRRGSDVPKALAKAENIIAD